MESGIRGAIRQLCKLEEAMDNGQSEDKTFTV